MKNPKTTEQTVPMPTAEIKPDKVLSTKIAHITPKIIVAKASKQPNAILGLEFGYLFRSIRAITNTIVAEIRIKPNPVSPISYGNGSGSVKDFIFPPQFIVMLHIVPGIYSLNFVSEAIFSFSS